MYQACATEAIDQKDNGKKNGDGDASSHEFVSLRTRNSPDSATAKQLLFVSCGRTAAGMVQPKIVRDKQPCMWVFSQSVPFWVGLSVKLCRWVLTSAFCKAVRAGAEKNSAFCEAVLPELWQTSSYACGLSVSLSLSGLGFL